MSGDFDQSTALPLFILRSPSDLLTFSVVTEAHLGLAQTNGIFASADAIEFLKLDLINTLTMKCQFLARATLRREGQSTHLAREVELNGLDADVLRAVGHFVIGRAGE
jgi:hypothetical protein